MENNGTQFLTDILTRIHSMKEGLEQLESAVLEQIDKATPTEPQEDTAEEVEPATAAAPVETEEAPEAAEEAEAHLPAEAAEEDEAEEETVFDFAEEEDMPDFNGADTTEMPAEPAPEMKETPVLQKTEVTSLPETPTLSEEEEIPVQQAAETHVLETEAETPVREEDAPKADILVIDEDFEVLPIGEAIAPAKDAVMDKMAEKESWRTDIPGTKVSDVRSAISLNDRVLFINTLFHEDPLAFQNALSQLNSMPSFDEGVTFILNLHPEWNTESDVVYRFMMAVRRKLH